MSLDSRVRCVVGVHNIGYANYYQTLLIDLGCLDEITVSERLISIGISRINKKKFSNRQRKKLYTPREGASMEEMQGRDSNYTRRE